MLRCRLAIPGKEGAVSSAQVFSRFLVVSVLTCVSSTLAACGGDDGDSKGGTGGGIHVGTGGGLNIGGGGSGNGGTPGTGGTPGPYQLPAGFTETEFGGYKLGDPFNGDTPPNVGGQGGATGETCGTTILAVVRDFKGDD